MHSDPRPYVLVALGGFFGAAMRYLIDCLIMGIAGTLVVNFLGCIALGIFMYESVYIGKFSRETRIFFAVGVIGAFTTFSTFAVQTFAAGPAIALLNIGAGLVLGLLGILMGRHIVAYQRGI